MKFALHMAIQLRTVCLSAHLDSFCRRIDELVDHRFELVYADLPGAMRRKVGWNIEASYANGPDSESARVRAARCDVLIDMLREFDIMERRVSTQKQTVYMCERWLKPLVLHGWRLPGILRLLVPRYFKMVRRLVRLMDDEHFILLPIGVHAVRDFVRLYKLLHGRLLCLFGAPKLAIDRRLGGAVEGFPRIRLWGYFVQPSDVAKKKNIRKRSEAKKILWVGRLLDLKRVDVLINAVRRIRGCSLVICGEGPERERLEKLAGEAKGEGLTWTPGKINFNGYVSNEQARALMREADVYVMPSNAEEGWGAAVSEALSEGCPVISTYEAGSSATLLQEECLFHADDISGLVERLLTFSGNSADCFTREWSGSRGAEILMEMLGHENHKNGAKERYLERFSRDT